jgi:hypothetical protein
MYLYSEIVAHVINHRNCAILTYLHLIVFSTSLKMARYLFEQLHHDSLQTLYFRKRTELTIDG